MERARGSAPARERAARLPRGEDAADLRQVALGDVGPLGEVPRRDVPRSPVEGEEPHCRPEADELPGAHAALRQPAPELPRPARCATPSRRRSTATSSTGALHGLTRVRHVTQDDAHIFCTQDQIDDEIFGCLDFAAYLYDLFGMEPRFELSTRPDNKLGTDEEWDFTEGALRSSPRAARDRVLRSSEGEGSFYGPKIDLHMLDVAGPLVADGDDPARRADAEAVRAHLHGRRQPRAHAVRRPPRAARLARAVHGDPDRALRRRVPGLARAGPGARPAGRGGPPRGGRASSSHALCAAGVRADADERDETLGKRIRDAELQKIPYVVVWGDRETREAMAVRRRGGEGIETLSLDGLVEEIRDASADVVALANESPAATLRDLQAGAASPLTSPATGRAGFNRVETDEGMPPLHATAFPRNEEDRLDLVNCL